MKNILLFFFFVNLANSFSQTITPQWSNSFGDDTVTLHKMPLAITTDNSNSMYVAGTMDSIQSREIIFFQKVSSAGQLIWQQEYFEFGKNYSINSIVQDYQNNFLLGGSDGTNSLILKYDSNGVLLGNYLYTDSFADCSIMSLLIDSTGVIYAMESADHGSYVLDMVLKISPSGNLIWRKSEGLLGQFVHTSLHNNNPQFITEGGYIIRLDTAGNLIGYWNSSTNVQIHVAKVDSVGNFFLAGNTDIIRVDSSFHTVWSINYPVPYQYMDIGDLTISNNYLFTTGSMGLGNVILGKVSYQGLTSFCKMDSTVFPDLNCLGIIRSDNNNNILVACYRSSLRPILLRFDINGTFLDTIQIDPLHLYQNLYTFHDKVGNFYLGGETIDSTLHEFIFRCDGYLQNTVRFYDPNYQNAKEFYNYLTVTPNGNIVSGGRYMQSNGVGVILKCFTPAGNNIWTINYVVPGYTYTYLTDIYSDAAGNIYLCGECSNDSGFVTMVGPNGVMLWADIVDFIPNEITSDEFGNVYAVGTTSGLEAGLVKINSSGNVVWNKKFLYPCSGKHLLYLSGSVYITVETLGPNCGISHIKVDSNGIATWQLNSTLITSFLMSYKFKLDHSNNIVSLGSTNGSAYFLKFDTLGNVIFESIYPVPTMQYAVAYDFDFGKDNSIYVAANLNIATRGCIARLDSMGNQMWIDTISKPGMSYSRTFAIKYVDDILLLGGDYKDTLSQYEGFFMVYDTSGARMFSDSFPILEYDYLFQTMDISFDNSANYYLVLNDTLENDNINLRKYSNSIVSTKNTISNSFLHLFPNPATDKVNWSSKVPGLNTIRIYSLDGNLIDAIESPGAKGFFSTQDYSPGIYIINFQTSQYQFYKKLVIHH